MRRFSTSALIIGLTVVAVAVAAAAFSWWRWERIAIVEGDIALPPGSEVIRISEPSEPGSPKVYTVQNRRPEDALRKFFSDELRLRGWEMSGDFENVARFSSGRRSLRIVFHREAGGTKFTLSLRSGR